MQSGQMSVLLNQTQDLADQLYMSDDPAQYLSGQGFTADGENWVRNDDDTQCKTEITIRDEAAEAGFLRYYTLSVLNSQDEALITLNNARYREVEP